MGKPIASMGHDHATHGGLQRPANLAGMTILSVAALTLAIVLALEIGHMKRQDGDVAISACLHPAYGTVN